MSGLISPKGQMYRIPDNRHEAWNMTKVHNRKMSLNYIPHCCRCFLFIAFMVCDSLFPAKKANLKDFTMGGIVKYWWFTQKQKNSPKFEHSLITITFRLQILYHHRYHFIWQVLSVRCFFFHFQQQKNAIKTNQSLLIWAHIPVSTFILMAIFISNIPFQCA